MKNNSSRYVYVFAILVLLLATLACGSSTTEKLEEASVPTSTTEVEKTNNTVTSEDQEPSSDVALEEEQKPTEEATEVPPTSTPEPTKIQPTPTPEPEPISVIKQGFGQDGRSAGYSFIVENPNSGLAFEDSQFQIAALDESGAIVGTDSGYITLLLPEQQLGIGGDLFVEEGVTLSSIEVQLNAGNPHATEPISNFTVESPSFFVGDYSSNVTGVIQSPYNRDFSDLRVSAVVYNEADEIIGGGYTFLNFILQNSSTGVNVSVTSEGDIARAEIHPVISSLSLLGQEAELPTGADNLILVNQGYGQDGNGVGFGIIIENPNNSYSIENSQYRITFFAEDGTVLETDDGYINTILPEQVLGIGGEVYVNDGQTVARVEAQLKQGDFIETTEDLPQFSYDNVTFSDGSYSSKVSGFIVNPHTQDVTNLVVHAIAYDENEDIIGGGYTYLDFAAANSKSAVEVTITKNGTPAIVELYAIPSSLTEFE